MSAPRRFRLKLVEVTTREDALALAEMFRPDDVWRNLQLKDPLERPGRFWGQFLSGLFRGYRFSDEEAGEEVGFFLLRCGRLSSQGIVEVDIAVPDRRHRSRGYAQEAFVLLFDEWLLKGRCREMWGWIARDNPSSLRMVEALSLPCYDGDTRPTLEGRAVPTVEVRLPRERWAEIRKTLPYPPP